MASSPLAIVLIAAATILGCGLFALLWVMFRLLGTYLVDRRQVKPSQINAMASFIMAVSLFAGCVCIALFAPHALPDVVVSIVSRSIYPLIAAALFCSWYIAHSIETLRIPPDAEKRPAWYRGPDREEWRQRGRANPAQRVSMSLLLTWVSLFCLLLGLGQMWTKQQRSYLNASRTRHIAATRRIESLGGLIQHGGYVSLANTQVQDDDLRVITGFDQLVSLNLGFTAITSDGLRHLGSLPSLRQLTLSGTNVDDRGLGQLGYLTGLRTLLMRSTRVNGSGFAELRPEQLVDLHSLDLSLCPLSPAGLRAIADVKCSLLRIDGRVVNATNLAELQELNVDTLEIGDMPADSASLRRLRQARPDIRVVTYDPSTQKRRRAE